MDCCCCCWSWFICIIIIIGLYICIMAGLPIMAANIGFVLINMAICICCD